MASSKLALLRSALIRPAVLSRGAVRCLPARSFSGGAAEEQDSPSSSSSSSSSSSDPFVNPPNEGLVYGRLTNIGRNALKTDIIRFFEGCDLNIDDIKVAYTKAYNPVGMLVQFPSRSSFDTALRQITRKGRLYNLMKIDREPWDYQVSYNGKTVLLKVQRNAVLEDIERVFHGCNHDASATEIIPRAGPELTKLALVRFPTRDEAMTAVRLRNKSFCLNTPAVMHVLQ